MDGPCRYHSRVTDGGLQEPAVTSLGGVDTLVLGVETMPRATRTVV